jgi:hypothetical protein
VTVGLEIRQGSVGVSGIRDGRGISDGSGVRERRGISGVSGGVKDMKRVSN